MTDNNTIVDSRIDPNAPATSDLFYHLRDNPIAMFEGSSGAPRLSVDATQGSVAGDVLLFSSVPAGYLQIDGIASSVFRATVDCELRVVAVRIASNGAAWGYKIYKNTTAIATAVYNTGTLTVDVTLSAGETVWAETTGDVGIRVDYKTGAYRSNGGA